MCSGEGNFEATLDIQHEQIFIKFTELITACEANFNTEEKEDDLMCPHHKTEHETFINKIKKLRKDLETHIEVHDKGLIDRVCDRVGEVQDKKVTTNVCPHSTLTF